MTVTIGGFVDDDDNGESVTIETLLSNAYKVFVVDDDGKEVILIVGIAFVIGGGAHDELYAL